MNQPTPASKFVVYYRVSTKGQKESGLGLEAKQTAVETYLAGQNGAELVAALEEVESGKNNKRPQLLEAVKLCKRHKATLLIAKLDRLARNVHFISGLTVEYLGAIEPAVAKQYQATRSQLAGMDTPSRS